MLPLSFNLLSYQCTFVLVLYVNSNLNILCSFLFACLQSMVENAMVNYRFSFDMTARNTTFTFSFLPTVVKCVQLPCYADRHTSVCSFSSLVAIRLLCISMLPVV